MNSESFQYPSQSAFSSRRTLLSSTSMASSRLPQPVTGTHLNRWSGWRYSSTTASPVFYTRASICNSSLGSALSHRGVSVMILATAYTASVAA